MPQASFHAEPLGHRPDDLLPPRSQALRSLALRLGSIASVEIDQHLARQPDALFGHQLEGVLIQQIAVFDYLDPGLESRGGSIWG